MPERPNVARLREAAPVILPSLLLCDFGNLEREVRRLEEAGARALHLDVMDGVFAPNITYGMPLVQAVRRLTDLPLDAHLMIVQPERYVEAFVDAGADLITVHIEALSDPRPVLARIRELGAAAGLALNPATPLADLEGALDLCDLVLVMSVPVGFGGQAFDPVALDKLQHLRQSAGERLMLEVDGGVNESTISRCARAGAGYFVAGAAVFRQPDYGVALRRLSDRAQGR